MDDNAQWVKNCALTKGWKLCVQGLQVVVTKLRLTASGVVRTRNSLCPGVKQHVQEVCELILSRDMTQKLFHPYGETVK